MADTKITDLASQTGAGVAATDLFVTVDVSDGTMSGTGTDKKITRDELALGLSGIPEANVTNLVTDLAGKAGALTRTAVKTSAYNAAAGDLVACDTTSAGFTVTLPTAPTDKTRIAVKMVAQGGTNIVTVAAGGSDVFNIAAGPTTRPVTLLNEASVYVYQASTAIWTTVENNFPLTAADLRYLGIAATAGGALQGAYPNPTLAANAVRRYGGLVSVGHSYTQVGGGLDAAGSFPSDTVNNYSHKVAAVVGVPAEEVLLLGMSGAAISCPDDGSVSGVPQGTGMILQHILPNHIYCGQITPTVIEAASSFPGLFLLEYGYNDPSRGGSDSVGLAEWNQNGRNAYRLGMRCAISRPRAKILHLYNDAAIVYTGTWTTNSRPTYSTRGTTEKTSTNADLFTYTIPVNFTGGVVAICLFGQPNGYTTANGAGTASASLIVVNRSEFPQSGNFDITIGGTAATVTAGHGTGAGTFTLSATKTWSNGAVVIRSSAGQINWTGTATGATGSTSTSGQGRNGLPIPAVKRFTSLTRADAGKTIIGTVASLGSNEICELDSVWIEDPTPPTVAVLNQPYGPFALSGATTKTQTVIANLNADIATVVAEFDGFVKLVDLNTQFSAWFGAVCHGATGTGTSFDIDVNDVTNTRIGIGSIIKSDTEAMLVTNMVAVSGTRYTLTVTRNYQNATSANLTDFGTAVSHADQAPINDIRWMRADKIHPSDYGHRLFTQLILEAVTAVPQTDYQLANTGAYVAKRQPGITNASYLYSVGPRGVGGAGAMTQYQEYAIPFYMPSIGIITEIGYYVTTARPSGGAGGVGRLMVRQDSGNGQPGYLIADFGQVASDITTTGWKNITGLWQPLKPGWFWLSMIPQGGAGVWTATVVVGAHRQNTAQTQGITSPYLSLGSDTAPASAADIEYPGLGKIYTSTATFTGAADSQWMNPFTSGAAQSTANGSTTATQLPVIGVKIAAPVRD